MLPGNAACESDVAHECNEQEQTQFPGHKAQIKRCTQGHFKKLIGIVLETCLIWYKHLEIHIYLFAEHDFLQPFSRSLR